MNRFRSIQAIILTALLAVASILGLPPAAHADTRTSPQTTTSPIDVPPGYDLLFWHKAKGVQIYECQDGQWGLRAPRAMLYEPQTGRPIAQHYGGIDRQRAAGPWWDALRDGSRIRAGEAVRAPSPNPDSIPLLRLKVLDWEGSGMFSPVRYIQRLNTVGGVGPTGACSAHGRVSVDYTADYYFYGTP